MPPRRVQKAPRKRSGCGSCKNAHVKCSEEKPTCKRCLRLSLPCQYEFKLVWEEDSLQRNMVHGRAGVWSRHGRKIEPLPGSLGFSDDRENLIWIPLSPRENWEFTIFLPEDFVDGLPPGLLEEGLLSDETMTTTAVALQENHLELAESGHSIRQDGRSFFETVNSNVLRVMDAGVAPGRITHYSPPLTPWAFDTDSQVSLQPSLPIISVSDVDAQLLCYYIYDLSPKCSLNARLNPYLNVLLPVAYDFEPLRHSLLAASACQLYHFSGNRQHELHSLRHRSKAIRGLNKHLSKERMDWKSLATMVMFCFRDITDGCEPSWITHLKMGMRMLKELLCISPIDPDLRSFCEIYFVAHDVMGRTAWGEGATIFEHYEWDRDDSYHEIDPIMGCSRELISLISQTSCLAGESVQQEHLVSSTMNKAKQIMNVLSNLEQTLQVGVENTESMLQIAEVKRLSAMLYLHDRVMASRSSIAPAFAHSLRDAIIDAIQQLPASSGASLWPLFVLGKSNLDNRDQAQFVLDRLLQLEQSRYLGSFYHARRRVERNITQRLTEHGNVSEQSWEDASAVNENERWVSLA